MYKGRYLVHSPTIARTGPVRAGQAHSYARLKNAVSLGNALLVFIEPRPIQRMRHSSHKLPRRVARKLGIRVQE